MFTKSFNWVFSCVIYTWQVVTKAIIRKYFSFSFNWNFVKEYCYIFKCYYSLPMPSEHLELFCRKVYIMNFMFYIYVRFTQFVCLFLLCFILVICILGFFYFIWTLKCIHNIAFYLFNICKTIHYPFIYYQFSSVKSLSHVWFFATPWMAARQASLSITFSWSSLRLMSIESVIPSSHLILYRPLFLLPPIPP